MTGRAIRRPDDGNAMLEFVWLAVLLMVPLVYLVITVFHVQSAAFGASSAARAAGRAYVVALSSGGDPCEAARDAAALALGDQGLTLSEGGLSLTTEETESPDGGPPRVIVHVVIHLQVGIPGLPAIGGRNGTVGVTARHDEEVDRYRGT